MLFCVVLAATFVGCRPGESKSVDSGQGGLSATVDEFSAESKAIPTTSGVDANYFSRSLRAVYLLLLTGGFTTCGGKPPSVP
jgi:hypothetical protein